MRDDFPSSPGGKTPYDTPNETITVFRSHGRRVGSRLLRVILRSPLFTKTRQHEILHQRLYALFGIPSESLSYLCLTRKRNCFSISGYCIAVGKISSSKLLLANIFQTAFDVIHVLMVFGPRSVSSASYLVKSLASVSDSPLLTAEQVRRAGAKCILRELDDFIVRPLRFKVYHTKRDRI